METTFGESISGPKRVPLSGGLLGSGPRPPSLLQRGKSFTSDDLLDQEPNAESGQDHRADLQSYSMLTGRGSGSSMSIITNSPPSSDDSHAVKEADMEVVVEPYTPTEQTFPINIKGQAPTLDSCTTPTGRKSGRAGPSESDDNQVGGTPRNTSNPTEVPWTAPVLGRSESSSNRRSNNTPPPREEDRYLKRQRTRSNPRDRDERARSEDREQ
jgi:hypothetical protein